MSDIDDRRSRKITLDMEIEDLVEMVSKRKGTFITETPPSQHSIEGEELKKAWFKHTLLSLEKLSDQIQDVRKTDLGQLKVDLKEEIKKLEDRINRDKEVVAFKSDLLQNKSDLKEEIKNLKEEIKKLEDRASKNQENIEIYKKEVVTPISVKLTTLTAKLGVWSIIASFVGSGLMTMLLYTIQKYYFK